MTTIKKCLTAKILLLCYWFNLANAQALNKHVIGASPGSGLFSAFFIVLNHILWCEKNNKIPVVYWDEQSPYWQPNGYNGSKNAWEYYFRPVSRFAYREGDIICRTASAPDGSEDIRYVYYACHANDNIKRAILARVHTQKAKSLIDKYIRVKPAITQKVEKFYRQYMHGKKTIGIHLRGTDKVIEYQCASPAVLLAEANKYAGMGYQFLVATDEQALLEQAKRTLKGPVIYYNSHRSTNGQAIHAWDNKHNYKAKAGEEVLIEVLLLARCNKFIHACSNVSTAVMCFNPNLEHKAFSPKYSNPAHQPPNFDEKKG